MSRWCLLVLVACRVAPPAPVVVEDKPKQPPPPEARMSATATTLGPITAKTPANLVALRAALVGFDVHPVNVDGKNIHRAQELEYQVFERGERLLRVIPSGEGGIVNVHITSPRVAVAEHDWRVGAPLVGSRVFTDCECWGANGEERIPGKPICFKRGEHVAVGFDRPCGGSRAERRTRRLEGATIAFLVWSPRPFGERDEAGGTEYGDGEIDGIFDPCGP